MAISFVLLATAASLFARIPILIHRPFDPDEFEHAHAAWSVFKGMLPYKDFFEHHTPWYYYLLSPFFHCFEVDITFDSARRFLIFGRALSLALTTISLLLVGLIGSTWKDRKVGSLAALLLVGQPFFFQKTIEMRPDVLALPFFLGSLWLLLLGLGSHAGDHRRRLRCFVGAGLCLGAAMMCTQKMLFVLPGAMVGVGSWVALAGRGRGSRPTEAIPEPAAPPARSRIFATMVFLVGVCIPAALTWAGFAVHHAGGEFIANNFLLNAGWKHVEGEYLRTLVSGSRPLVALSAVGVVSLFYRFCRFHEWDYQGALLFCTMAGLFAGLLVVPVAYRQYYLMPLPIVCLFAAQGLFAAAGCFRQSVRRWLIVAGMIALASSPIRELRTTLKLRNDHQLATLRYAFDNTKPTDLVMDGWVGTGVFRPHAFYYFFIHGEFADRLPRERVDAYLDALESGKIRPRLIAMDENLVSLGSRFLRFVKANYVNRDMAGQEHRTAEWRKLVKRVLKKNYVSWNGFFYFSARDTE